MPWWGWMIIGLFLLGSELLGVDVAFYLVFIGIAAILTGAIAAAGIVQEPWLQWLLFSVLAIISMVWFRKRVYQKLHRTSSEYQDGLTGETIRLEEPLDPGQTSRQSFRGTDWTITNRGSNRIEAQSEVQIDSTEGLTLIVSGSNS
jgi:membrane protein implicated in regulation of membrane protease activity